MSNQVQSILRVDASARYDGSQSRRLGDHLIDTLKAKHPAARVSQRDVALGLPFIDEAWVGANFTDPTERSTEQNEILSLSNRLVDELKAADTIVITTPIYNFGIPAALKAWIDLIARARLTFRYTENGPVGLLEGKKAYVVVTSGGTEVGSDIDFATGYLRHVLGFIGITDVDVIAADQLMMDAGRVDAAREKIAA